jgi:hypothetical protein
MEFPIKVACQCGQLTYTMLEKQQMVLACHCTECQKLSTSADSGNTNSAKSCPSCGNRIYHYNPDDLETIKLKLKPFNVLESSLFEPSAHVGLARN